MDAATEKEKLEGAVWILEQLIEENPIHERKAARRVLSEVMRAWPGNVERLWWKWISESASSLNLRTKTLDCTIDEAISLARDGAQILLYLDKPSPQWLSVLGTSKNKFHTAVSTEIVSHATVSNSKLYKQLSKFAVD